jgi:hypothetical protein
MMAYKNGEDHTGTNDSERLDKNRSTNELWRYETPQEPGIFDLRKVSGIDRSITLCPFLVVENSSGKQ